MTQARARLLVSELELGPTDGLWPGTYEVRVTRRFGKKEVVLAQGRVTLR